MVAQVLKDAGVNATHQSIRHEHVLGRTEMFYDMDVDVSFEAAPWAEKLSDGGVRIVWLRRDPVRVIESWIALGAFQDNMNETHMDWWESMKLHTPATVERWERNRPWSRAMSWIEEWTAPIEEVCDSIITLDENLTRVRILSACGYHSSDKDPLPHVDEGTPGPRNYVPLAENEKLLVKHFIGFDEE